MGARDKPHAERREKVGLCAACAHSHRVESSRGAEFYLCRLSATDSAFPKYPRLPVLSCEAYLPANEPPRAANS